MTTAAPERRGAVLFRGNPATLVGPELKAGPPAPDFGLVDGSMKRFTLNDAVAGGKRNALLIVVPSLDTPVCSVETSTFHKRLAELPSDTQAFVVSLDLPFAQKRWAGENDANGIEYLSDFREKTFGPAYGVLLKDLGLFARAIFLVGKDKTLRYVQLVPDVATEPNYDETIAAAAKA